MMYYHEYKLFLALLLEETKKLCGWYETHLHAYHREGDPKEVSTGRECDPSRWNARANRAKGSKKDIRGLNAYLDTMARKVADTHLQLERRCGNSAESLKLKYLGKDVQRRYLNNAMGIDIRRIDHAFITGYELFLRSDMECSAMSAAKYMKHRRKLVHCPPLDYGKSLCVL